MPNVWAGGAQVWATVRTEELLIQETELLSKNTLVVGVNVSNCANRVRGFGISFGNLTPQLSICLVKHVITPFEESVPVTQVERFEVQSPCKVDVNATLNQGLTDDQSIRKGLHVALYLRCGLP